jgi:hypothetical protein
MSDVMSRAESRAQERPHPPRPRSARAAPLAALALAALAAGCVRRTIFVRTEPERAKVFLDGTYIGDTPRLIPFTYYGVRDLVLRPPYRAEPPFYGTARVSLDVDPPWYEYTPLDFFAEILTPWTIEDERQVFVTLPPAKLADPEAVRERAEGVRAGASPTPQGPPTAPKGGEEK